ncbi:hypothetical protein [Microtetraspora fusca]|uniref:hypothetical protein n=1 Tax=Microtetraspora fusca TaxID=1997 RepID=UPI000A8C363E|nr:hypothetical protein [Microtetraspora fusca]
MRKSLRLAVAAATGAALFATGAAITVASPANAVSAVALRALGIADIKVDTSVAFIPPTGSDTIPFVIKVNDPYVGNKAPTIKAEFWKEGEQTTSAGHSASVTQLTDLANSTPAPTPPTSPVEVKGTIPVSSSDKPTTSTGKWTLRVTVKPDGGDAVTKDETFEVKAATRVNGASVSPNPVTLKSGKDVDVFVAFELEKSGDEKLTDVRLESKSYDDYISLSTGMESDGKSYHDSASFDYSTSTGAWQLKITVTRGSKTYSFVKGFEVKKSGSSKASSKITLTASPTSLKKGKTTKLSGKVYRGSGAWKKKIMKLYFKKKGSSKWSFVGYVGSSSTGKFSKTVKPKYTGYWRLAATGTSTTYGSYSNYKLVTVK